MKEKYYDAGCLNCLKTRNRRFRKIISFPEIPRTVGRKICKSCYNGEKFFLEREIEVETPKGKKPWSRPKFMS